jgi:glycosyltransferase involved in cell wall biosynthesis
LSRAQTCAAYKAADLFVLAAKAETQPVVLLEAMASHTPWLSTDTGCVSELPGGIVARLEDDLVVKMRELASSPALRQGLAAEGWAACQKTYDWERVVAAYDRLITKVCGQG